jgi:hypothetical protein
LDNIIPDEKLTEIQRLEAEIDQHITRELHNRRHANDLNFKEKFEKAGNSIGPVPHPRPDRGALKKRFQAA